jgi:hypothetical protein
MNTGQLSVFQLPCIHLAPKPEACRHFIFLQNTGKHLLRHTLKIIDSPEGLKIIQKNTDANKKGTSHDSLSPLYHMYAVR